ncbi:uncharacterized protein LOC134705866 [Mytilus trossulus]|uniref:uncharacterized protein LOC134705866 n=1 Tax=Mytilus trossulus TaxID=6551 RepID=UPI003007C839
MADAMLSKTDSKSLKKGSSASNEAKGKNPKRKSSGDDSRSKNDDTSSCSSGAKIVSSGEAGTVASRLKGLSQNTGEASKEPTLAEVFSVLKNMQQEQSSQKTDFVSLKSMVDELYYVEPEGYEESQGADPEVFDENNNDNNDHVGDTEVAEPPAKKQKTVDKEGDNVFKAAAQAYRSKDNVDTSVDDTLADTVNECFREGISDEKYNELMKSVARPENCVSLTRTRVNQLIWDLLSPQTRSFDSVIQQHQETVVKASCNITKLLNMLCKLKSELGDDCQQEMQSCIDLGIDSIALLSQYNKMTNIKRKEYQRFDLSPEYHHLSSPSIPFTDMLYGDNVHQKSKEIQDMNRLGRNLNINNNARGRGNGFSRGGSFGRGRGFGRGRAGSRRGGYRGGRGRGYGGRGQYSNDQGGSKNLRGVPSFLRK